MSRWTHRSHTVERLKDHPSIAHFYGVKDSQGKYVADAGAAFGTSPPVSTWQMSHGSGGGLEDVPSWVTKSAALWNQAAERLA